jgi:S1-C subfamily serine protease
MSIRKAADQAGMTRQPPLPSGHVYPATVVGSDPAQGLALVQLEGGSTFKPAAIGNSGDFAAGAAAISVSTGSTVMGMSWQARHRGQTSPATPSRSTRRSPSPGS